MIADKIRTNIWKNLYEELLENYAETLTKYELTRLNWKEDAENKMEETWKLRKELKESRQSLKTAKDEVRILMAKISESEEKTAAVFDTASDVESEMVQEFEETIAGLEATIARLRDENVELTARIEEATEIKEKLIVANYHWRDEYFDLVKDARDAGDEIDTSIGLTD